MKKVLALAFIMLLPLASCEEVDIINPDGYLNEILRNIGVNSTADDILGGGGNPISQATDPIIAWFNENLLTGTPLDGYGFVVFYTIAGLLMSLILVPFIGGFLLSYLAYFFGKTYNLPYTFWLMVVGGIIGTLLFYKIFHKQKTFARVRKFIFILLILFVIGICVLFVLTFFPHLIVI